MSKLIQPQAICYKLKLYIVRNLLFITKSYENNNINNFYTNQNYTYLEII